MSGPEVEKKREQEHVLTFKKLEGINFKISGLQILSILCILGNIGIFWNSKTKENTLDLSTLGAKIDNVANDVRYNHKLDQAIDAKQRLKDSTALALTLDNFKKDIIQNINTKLATTNKRLSNLENRVTSNFAIEVKKHGPEGPVTVKAVNNK